MSVKHCDVGIVVEQGNSLRYLCMFSHESAGLSFTTGSERWQLRINLAHLSLVFVPQRPF